MNEILAKLTNLGYEFFGVILPGTIAVVFFGLSWAALGPLPPCWTHHAVPHLSAQYVLEHVQPLNSATGVGTAVLGILTVYLVGHILLWFARQGGEDEKSFKAPVRRVWRTLTFRPPKPKDFYDKELDPLLRQVQVRFFQDRSEIKWREFYPVVKNYLAVHLTSSLISTYQNKYTLHRSIATAAAAWFLMNLLGVVAAFSSLRCCGCAPHWGFLTFFSLLSLTLVWGFSGSYMYHWRMFGNTIITESYALLCGPKNAETQPK